MCVYIRIIFHPFSAMIFISHGNRKENAYVWREIGNLISIVNIDSTVSFEIYIKKPTCYIDKCATCSELPSYISTMSFSSIHRQRAIICHGIFEGSP